MNRGRRVSAAVALACATVAAVTVGSVGSVAASARHVAAAASSPATMNVRLEDDVDSLNPDAALDTDAQWAAMFAYDSILADVGGKIESQIATKWKVTPTSIKLWIRRGVTCSDGHHITPGDVVNSINFFINPKSPSIYTDLVFGSLTGINAAADAAQGTVTIRIPHKYGGLLYGMPRIYVICPAGLANPSMMSTQSFGTGPYVLTQAVTGDHYTYVKRTGYTWGPGGATTAPSNMPKTVVLRVVTSDTTAANLLLTGALDIAIINGPDQARLKGYHDTLTDAPAAPYVWGIRFNEQTGDPTANEDVRLGLAESVNRVDLAQAAGGQFARVASTLLSPNTPCYDASQASAIPKTNLAAARKAFAAAGYTMQNGKLMKGGQQLTIRVRIWNGQPNVVDYLISAWQPLGIAVDGQEVSGTELGTILTKSFAWDVTVNDTAAYDTLAFVPRVSGAPPPAGENEDFINNTTYDRLTAQASQHVTSRECALWKQANRSLLTQVDLVPVYWEDVAQYSKDATFTPVSYAVEGAYPTSIRFKK